MMRHPVLRTTTHASFGTSSLRVYPISAFRVARREQPYAGESEAQVGWVYMPTNPVIDAVGRSNDGGQLAVPLSTSAPLRIEGRPRRADHRLPLAGNDMGERA